MKLSPAQELVRTLWGEVPVWIPKAGVATGDVGAGQLCGVGLSTWHGLPEGASWGISQHCPGWTPLLNLSTVIFPEPHGDLAGQTDTPWPVLSH